MYKLVVLSCAISIGTFAASPLPTNQFDQITGLKGKCNAEKGVYKVSAPRTDMEVTVDNWQMPPFMGLTSWAAFAAVTALHNTWSAFAGKDDNAVVDGDFVVLEKELQPVLKSLHKSGINIVAILHHMSSEEPRMLFLHYWGRGSAQELTQSVKRALEVENRP